MPGKDSPLAVDISSDDSHDQSLVKLLVVDDDRDVHNVTRLALSNFAFQGSKLELLHAYSGEQAVARMRANPDIAVILLDIVMETELAGWDAVARIRDELDNEDVQIIVRSGFPGTLSERKLIELYGINDYRDKGTLTREQLYIAVDSALRAFRNRRTLMRTRNVLSRIMRAGDAAETPITYERIAQKALAKFLKAVPGCAGFCLIERPTVAPAAGSLDDRPIIAGVGIFGDLGLDRVRYGLDEPLWGHIASGLFVDVSHVGEDGDVLHSSLSDSGRRVLVYAQGDCDGAAVNQVALHGFANDVSRTVEMGQCLEAMEAI